ncbi:MAG: hypothetical protein HZC51_12670, partial [Nitrospirae bacterium]|nr:hypothetical protein [Nitrospirota bacterium]
EGKFKIDKNKPVEEAALDFIDRHRNAFGLQYAKKEFKLSEKKHRSSYGDAFIHYQQIYNDIPIWGKVLTVHQNKDQDIDLIISGNIPTPNIDTTPLITAEEAIGYAKADQNIPADVTPWPANAELMIYENLLAYMVEIDEWRYFIDAEKGSVISKTCTTRFEAVRGSQ